MSPSVSCAVSGVSVTSSAFAFGVTHSGRTSRSSGRARQSRSTGAPRSQSARYSSRSRNVGSPQWMSSNTATSGRCEPRCSNSLRTPRRSPGSPAAPGRRRGAARAARRRARSRRRRRGARRSCAAKLGPVALADPGGVHEGRRDRPERDALAVREAAALDDGRVVAEPGSELVAEARLPDPGRAEHGDELARSSAPRGRTRRRAAELAVAADHRQSRCAPGRGAPARRPRAGRRGERLGLALHLERPDGRRPRRRRGRGGRWARRAGSRPARRPAPAGRRCSRGRRGRALPGGRSPAKTSPVLTPVRVASGRPSRARAPR